MRRNNLEDLFDLKRFRYHPKWRTFQSFSTLLGVSHEHQARRKAIRMYRDMLRMLADDLLEGNYFVFPYQKFGHMRIGDLRHHKNMSHIPYDIMHKGKVLGGVVFMNTMVMRTIGGKGYNLSLTQANMKRLRDLRDQGRSFGGKSNSP